MSTYTLVENGIVTNVIEATEDYILTNHDDDVAVLGRFPIGYLFVDGGFIPPERQTPPLTDIVQTSGYTGVSNKTVIPLTNIAISATAELNGSIYWLQQGVLATITANVVLPDGDYMLMVERVIDASTVVDDVRFKATVSSGALTMIVSFPIAGNYLLSSKRLNEGLDRIGAPFNLGLDDVEFDIYV